MLRKAIAVPIVDSIKWQTLEHRSVYNDKRYVGIFEWGFLYKEKVYEPIDTDARYTAPYKYVNCLKMAKKLVLEI